MALAALAAAATALTALTPAPANASVARVATIVVAPEGSDRNQGTADHPLATLARAQRLARGLSDTSDVVVELSGGTYRLTQPWKLSSADSGRNGHTVTWRAQPGEAPVVSGGRG
ncbi:hypothetical protein ACFQ10_01065 [Streptomyces indonesiensis]